MPTRSSVLGWLVCALAASGAVSARSARAAEATRVVSGSRARGQLFDFNLSVGWWREDRRAAVRREFQDQSTGGRTIIVRDLTHRQTRNVLGLRADIGVVHDVSLFVTAPIVLSDNRSLSFDRRDGSCDMPGMRVASPRCIDESNSTLLRDGILPGAGSPMYGLDARHGRPFQRPSDMVFRGPTRRGLEYLGLGIAWALMNQARDPTMPTWVIRFEPRLAVTSTMEFDPAKPDENTAVGLGYHQFVFSTSFSRQFERFDPYLGGYYILPKAKDDSPFKKYPLGTKGFGSPQHRAGAEAGVEVLAYDDPRARQRVTLELRGYMELRFFGLARSELWEPLSGSSLCTMDRGACRRDLDRDLNGDRAPDPFPGITRSPSYGVFGAAAGINVTVGRYVRFRALGGLTREQSRFLSDGRSGSDLIDIPGRRFRVEDAGAWHLLVEGGLLF